MFALFSVYQCEDDEKKRNKALELMECVYNKMPDTEYGKRALLVQGEFLYCKGYPQRAKKKFTEIIKKYPGTWQAKGAGHYLKELNVEKIKKRREE